MLLHVPVYVKWAGAMGRFKTMALASTAPSSTARWLKQLKRIEPVTPGQRLWSRMWTAPPAMLCVPAGEP